MNLCIDQGNTRTKIAVFQPDGTLLATRTYTRFTVADAETLCALYHITNTILSSVANLDTSLISTLQRLSLFFLLFTVDTPVPIDNQYDTPQTLGCDRLAAAVGANLLFPDENLLVVDAGSAITYDFVNADNAYCGGNIAPGIHMRIASLNEHTQKLPLITIEPKYHLPLLGKNTFDAIAAGVVQGILFEWQGYTRALAEKQLLCRTVLTGGDASYLAKYLPQEVICEESLVLIGLNRILEYNLQ